MLLKKLRSKRNYLRPYKMAKHINEARKEDRFDWRKADAKSRRRKWADAVSQKKLTLPAEIPPVTSHRPHQYKERTTKSTAPPSEVLQIDALKPRNSRILQTRIYHHTFDQLDSLQLNEEDSLFRDYSELVSPYIDIFIINKSRGYRKTSRTQFLLRRS